MASTSSSPKETAAIEAVEFSLLLENPKDGSRLALALDDEPAAGDVDFSHVLVDRAPYRLHLLASGRVDGATASLALPGSDPVSFDLRNGGGDAGDEEARRYRVPLDQDTKPFKLAVGFVQVGVDIDAGAAGKRSLRTRPTICSCTIPNLREHVAGMLAALRSPAAAPAVRLMASRGGDGRGDDAGAASGVDAFLALAQRCAEALERSLPALRLKPCAKTRPVAEIVPARRARRAGRAEAAWLERNPSAIRRGRGGKTAVERVASTSPQAMPDVAENLAVLAFAADVAGKAASLARALGDSEAQVAHGMEAMAALEAPEGCLPALLIASEQLRAVSARRSRAEGVSRRARRVQRELERAWKLRAPRRFQLPRRSKPFQEIEHYARLFPAMALWARGGQVDAARETMLLSASDMPRLYELFCLEEMLRWCLGAGFSPAPARSIRYSLRSRFFSNERRVSNRYELARGDETIEIWYQPVIYGDERDEAGIGLHRLTAGFEGEEPYWTPDFAVRATRGGETLRTIAVDAKFTHPDGARSLLEKCKRKYKDGTCFPDGRRVDAVAVLCGKGRADEGWEQRLSSWAETAGMLPDGYHVLSSPEGCLDDVLGRLFA